MGISTAITTFEGQTALSLAILLATILISLAALRFVDSQFSIKTKGGLIVLCVALWFISIYRSVAIIHMLIAIPTVQTITPSPEEQLDLLAPRIVVTFATPVKFWALGIYTYPEYELTVTPQGYMGNRLPFGRSITITPTTTIEPNQRIMVYLTNIKSVLGNAHGAEHLIERQTPEVEVTRIDPSNATDLISPRQSFYVSLSVPTGFESEWSVISTPPHPMHVERQNPTTLAINPATPLQQATDYTLTLVHTPIVMKKNTGEVLSRGQGTNKATFDFKTVHPAFVASFEPQGIGVHPQKDIIITFDQPMDTKSVDYALSLSSPDTSPPSLTTTWNNEGTVAKISHDPFPKDSTQTVTLSQGLRTKSGSVLEEDAIFSFTTAGELAITNSSPRDSTHGVSILSPIRIEFDQEISDSVQKYFSLSPPIAGTLTTHGRKLEFVPSQELAYNTTYTVNISPGAQSMYGLASSQAQSFSFTTSANETILNVPYFRQQDQFTCNIAAARMLLAFHGVSVEESSLVQTIGTAGKRGSGNPFKGYVNDYGTYWDAVAKGVSLYRPIRMIGSGSLSDIIAEIEKGNPVMIWGQNGWSDPHDLSWTTPDGIFIKAINGMHSSVVRGFRGPAESPTHILLNDPWRGQYAIDTNEFIRRWQFLSMAMVVD